MLLRCSGKTFGKGDNITSIRHSDTELEFALNGKSQGIIKLEKPIPSDAVGCASMCAHAGGKPAILSLHGGPVPPPQPPPPKLPVGSVRLATCDSSNPRQRFVYDQEARSVSYHLAAENSSAFVRAICERPGALREESAWRAGFFVARRAE